ncbi:MAG TPA: VCBS domain-containing protein [Rhizomicrobium sp.]|jgi:VCBS repeat-containing protein|nr:VCBS domain-containing protein [Rhizomicrobium sp.]
MSNNRLRDQILSSVGIDVGDPTGLRLTGHEAALQSAHPIVDGTVLPAGHAAETDASQPAHFIVAPNAAHTLPITPGHAANDGSIAYTPVSNFHAQPDNFHFTPEAGNPALAATFAHDTILPADPIHAGDSLGVDHTIAGYETDLALQHHLANAQGHSLDAHTSAPDGSPPSGGDPDGQLWEADAGDGAGNPDGHSDFRVEHDDSDGLSNDQTDEHDISSTTGVVTGIGLDTAANLYFAEDSNDQFYVGNIATGAILTTTTIASTSDEDVTNAFVVDPRVDTIYMDLDGGDYHADGGDIIKITYNPTTGAISSPYNPSTFAINLNSVLVDTTSSGNIYQDGRSFVLSNDGSTLYYVDNDEINPAGSFGADTNGIYKVSTSGDVGQGTAPTPVLLSSQAQFPVNESAGSITALTLNSAQGLIYFTTQDSAGIWYMPIAGGTAQQMTLPSGITFSNPPEFGNGITFDPDARDVYVADQARGVIIRLELSTDGKSFVAIGSGSDTTNDFRTEDSSGDGAFANALTWDTLPTETGVAGTSAFTTQGSGSATTLLTGSTTISDPDGTGFHLAGETIRVIGGTKGDGTAFGVTSGAIASGTGISGDNLLVDGAQSGTVDSGKVTVSWNASTETLTLSGNDPDADYQTLLTGIAFQENAGTDNTIGSHPTRVIDFIANDGTTVAHPGTTDPNEKTITITLNRAPTLATDSYTAQESGSASGTSGTGGTGVLGNDSDPDGDSISVSQVNGLAGNVGSGTFQGTYGHLNLASNGSFTYTADNTSAIDSAATGSHPIDSFTYQVSDGDGGLTSSTVSFTINRAPTLGADSYSVVESASSTGTAGTAGTGVLGNDSDKDGDSLTVADVNGSGGNVGSGTFQGTYGHFDLAANGSFTYTADDTSAIDSAATGSHPTDTFTYTVSDGHGGTTTQTVSFTIDRDPTLGADAYNVVESNSVSGTSGTAGTGVLGNDSDKDGDSLTVSAVNGSGANVGSGTFQGTYGHFDLAANGSFTYNADNTSAIDSAATGSHLTDSFTYTASDGHGGTTTQTVTFTLDRAPTVTTENETVAESATTTGTGGTAGTGALAGDSDRDGDSIQATKLDGNTINDTLSNFAGTYGHLTIGNDGSYSYVADNTSAIDAAPTGSHPIDTFTVTVDDGHGGTTNETLNFSIDRPGIAQADSISTTESSTVTASTRSTGLLGNDSDPDTGNNTGLSVTAVNGSAGNVGNQINFADGSFVTVNSDGTYTYDPNHAWDFLPAASSGAPSTGTETFTYTITGGSTQTVTITINGQDSNDTLQGTSGNDTYNGGIGDDIFKMQDGGNDNVNGGVGNDTFYFGAALTAADVINGGTGTDTLVIGGDYTGGNALVLSANSLTSVEQIDLHAGFSYDITADDANVAAGATLTVNAAQLGNGDTVTFDGSAETDGRFLFKGGIGTNNFTGGAGNDVFDLTFGGTDTVHGGGGNDVFNLDGQLTAADSIDGGAGVDTLTLSGEYDSLVLGANTITNVEIIRLAPGFDYNITTDDATVAAGQTLTVNGSALDSSSTLTFDGSAETDGSFIIKGGAGNDHLTGGAGNDTFDLNHGGNDTVHGGGGNDVFAFDGAFTAADVINGGAGTDTLTLNGDYSSALTLGSNTITSVERIALGAGHDYNLILNGLDVANGQTLTVDGSHLGAGDDLTFDGSAVSDGGRMVMTGGAGTNTLYGGSANDTLHGGSGVNVLQGGVGADLLTGGGTSDTFVYAAPSESTSTGHDTITDFNADTDHIDLQGYFVNAIDAAITTGALGSSDFDTALAKDVNASNLAAHDAVLFTASSGSYHGHTFLVVDINGVAGYQAGQDIVIDVTGATNMGDFSASNFTS